MTKLTIDTDDLVSMATIAERCEVSYTTAHMWFSRRETNDFPAPVIDMRGARLFSWEEVQTWLNA